MKLKEKYKKEVIPKMMDKFEYTNPNSCPKIEKVVVNSGFGGMITDKTSSEREKIQEYILKSLSLITGQKPAPRKAKKAIAGFKLRKGMIVGGQVILRGKRMYDFIEKLIMLVLPRTRDFRGLPLKSVDKEGNFTIGLKEFTSFPEVLIEKEKGIFGLEISIHTTAKNRDEGIELLRLLGFPMQR